MKRPTPPTRSLTEVPGWIKKTCERCEGAFWSVPSQFKYTRFCAKDCRHLPWEERLWENVVPGANPDDCWTFKLVANSEGYPYLKKDGKEERVSRLMWELHNGPIPEEFVIRHTCDNTKCINPDHLLVGTQSQNIQDCVKRKRHVGNRTLTLEQVEEIRKLRREGMILKAIAELFQRSIYTVWCICNGRTWGNY